MDRYSNIEEYALAKARIFEYQTADDFGVLNADNPAAMRCAPSIKSRLTTFSRKGNVRYGTFARGTEVWWADESGERFICDTKSMKLRGAHNLENVLAAVAAAVAMGVCPSAIQSAVDSFEAPEHRLEPVSEIGGVEFINNSMCTNVDAAVASLTAIERPAIVIAGGKDKGSDYAELGRAFVRHAKHVVLIGADAAIIENAARAAGFDKISHAGSMEDAVLAAWHLAVAGDTVVLSPGCASFDMFNDFEHRGRVFKSAVADLKASVEAKV
jgi:UDP-N-acetylmuramoylalanine--D-glutamate ligase